MSNKAGRPTKYNRVDLKQVKMLAEWGFTDQEFADFYEVKRKTIGNWKNQYPEFLHTLKKGKAVADSKVVKALFERATGYSDPDNKHYPPDTTAAIFWLKNRQPDSWRDKRDIEVSTPKAIKVIYE